MQSRHNIIELLETGVIEISSTNEDYPFNKDHQVGSDSIDLRLGEYFFKIRDDFKYINTLSITNNFANELFVKHNFNSMGYILKPQEIIFLPTLERINMKSPRYYGYVSGRSIYSRLGLSVHCTMTKFGFGMNSIISLQVINNSPVPLKIYPKQKLVQLEIHEIYGKMTPYDGRFSLEKTYLLPITKESELESYIDIEKRIIQDDEHVVIRKTKYDESVYRKLNFYFKAKKIIGSLLGIGGLVSFFGLYAQKPDAYILALVLISLLITIDFIYTELALSKGVSIDEQ
ncbi:dCTP deaminase domain-containing protein [Desulforegula conservatrix]|uniref:dCTP deaminase domain-containing protein n=1 Tax=Desulforegula conservatrix TaxID=153026 RepID=UPI000412B610|nr:hypothetical protein [Desulforegula conservatrix]